MFSLTGNSYSFTHHEKTADVNAAVVREACRKYVNQRASGEAKSELADESDVLSLMLKTPDVFETEDIIDELIDFIIAGT